MPFTCAAHTVTVHSSTIFFFFFNSNFLLLLCLHCRLPYAQNRISNLLVRLNTRLRLPFMAVFVLCFILLWGVKINSCFSFVTSWNGLLPIMLFILAADKGQCWAHDTEHFMQIDCPV